MGIMITLLLVVCLALIFMIWKAKTPKGTNFTGGGGDVKPNPNGVPKRKNQ